MIDRIKELESKLQTASIREKAKVLDELASIYEDRKKFQKALYYYKQEIEAQAEHLLMANVELLHKNEELEEVIKEKNEFLGIISHDLRSPLTVIIGISEILESWGLDSFSKDELDDFVGDIKNCADQIFQLASKLLDLNRLESGKMKLKVETFDFRDSIKSILKEYAQRAENKKISFAVDFADQKYAVKADKDATLQVLNNLISNSIKYSDFEKKVNVRLTKNCHFIRCEIQDEGQGFTEEDKKKVFQKFAHLSAKPTGGEESVGLGLSIVKRLVSAMNGNVWLESEGKGKGTTFFVELPIAYSRKSPHA